MIIPDIILSIAKITIDCVFLGCGIFFFVKFRALLKNKLMKNILKKRNNQMKPLDKNFFEILKTKLFEIIIIIAFLAFGMRIFIKDLFFSSMGIDEFYLDFCNCNDLINTFYLYQALIFDIIDFSIAILILHQIYKDASKIVTINRNNTVFTISDEASSSILDDINNINDCRTNLTVSPFKPFRLT